MNCDSCSQTIVKPENGFTTGYGTDSEGRRHCYACCAERDRQSMRETGRATLYLVKRDDGWHATNWPGSLDIKLHAEPRKGYHNMARYRYDVWFDAFGRSWHGVQYGDNTQILHCRSVKSA